VPNWQGLEVRLPRGENTYRNYELRYDPNLGSADLWIDGERRLSGYRGHDQFVDPHGLLFGAAPFQSPVGVGVFRSVRFEINP
jgi:hypothetical protein